MAFLDNSGDIILDAVLTDTGRARLARADGTFRIAKFALGDDEIDYGLYNKDNASNQQDLEIMQTPILEAFTNNSSLLKSRLTSFARTNLLYLPVLKLNTIPRDTKMNTTAVDPVSVGSTFIVAVDLDTTDDPTDGIGTNLQGLMLGAQPDKQEQSHIRIDQGLDTDELTPKAKLDVDLRDETYIIEIDNRLGRIVGKNGESPRASFVDDDQIASYVVSAPMVTDINNSELVGQKGSQQTIKGPRGTKLEFRIASSIELQGSDYLFTTLGKTSQTYVVDGSSVTGLGTIDTHVRVSGMNTGYRLDVPVQFVKKIS
jgi:hypothetical protein